MPQFAGGKLGRLQRGGFDVADARRVVELLNQLPVDLLELSGGTRSPGDGRAALADGSHPGAREAYFLEHLRATSPPAPACQYDHRWHPPPGRGATGARQRRLMVGHRHRAGVSARPAGSLAQRRQPQRTANRKSTERQSALAAPPPWPWCAASCNGSVPANLRSLPRNRHCR